jgi:hypothetical protein
MWHCTVLLHLSSASGFAMGQPIYKGRHTGTLEKMQEALSDLTTNQIPVISFSSQNNNVNLG